MSEPDGDAVVVTVDASLAKRVSAGGELAAKEDAGQARMELSANEDVPAGGEPVIRRMRAPVPEYLEASPILNHEDAAVRRLLSPIYVDCGPRPPGYRADQLRRIAHEHIESKDLSVGFATASDVARTRQGDCTEHAVLLAALFRGAGIPSRCVTGLVYADQFAGHEGVFGFHMWTQAWVVEQWVDYDATLPDGVRFDATHIALSVSDLNDGLAGSDMAAMVPLLGNLEIEVVETGYGEGAE